MKTYVYLWYLAGFFLEWEMFQKKVVEKLKTHILCSVTFFFRKSYRLRDNVENMVQPDRPQTTIQRMLQTHTQNMKYLLLFHSNNGYANTPRCCVIRTLPILFRLYKATRELVQLVTHITPFSDCFAWRQAEHRSPLFQFSMSRCPRVELHVLPLT